MYQQNFPKKKSAERHHLCRTALLCIFVQGDQALAIRTTQTATISPDRSETSSNRLIAPTSTHIDPGLSIQGVICINPPTILSLACPHSWINVMHSMGLLVAH